MKSKRTLALEWWRKMSTTEKQQVVEEWKATTMDSKREWDFVLVCMSTTTIEQIWKELYHKPINK
jgi:hypothetical protein